MNDTTNETTALILAGEGYQLSIAPEAEARKLELMQSAARVLAVCDNDESADAQRVIRSLAGMRTLVEKNRKEVKEPVIRIGKLIDQVAKDFLSGIEGEETRVRKLVGDHAAEVARVKAAAEAAERKAFEDARAAREAAEAAAAKAEETRNIGDVIAARQAEMARQEAAAARLDASDETAAAKVADGVRFAIDFEVTDIELLAKERRDLVTVTEKRAAILAELRDAGHPESDDYWKAIGLRVFLKPVVSSR